MKKLTIFTPTYNRAYCLPELYESLLVQNKEDFVWMVVDDGSTDETKKIIDKWICDGKINIIYIYQQNSGKMSAHNRAVKECNTELFMCLDSDDKLTDGAVHKIVNYWNQHGNDCDNLCGIIAPKLIIDKKNDTLSTPYIPHSLIYTTGRGLYQNGYKGETAMVFKTEILKNFPFPLQENEKFISEISAYDQIDGNYVMVTLDEPLMICKYREDGYSKNIMKVNINNPKGVVFVNLQRQRIINRFSPTLMREYIAYSLIAKYGMRKIIFGNKYPLFCLLLFPLGYFDKQRILKQAK